jgi:hypothetical protein
VLLWPSCEADPYIESWRDHVVTNGRSVGVYRHTSAQHNLTIDHVVESTADQVGSYVLSRLVAFFRRESEGPRSRRCYKPSVSQTGKLVSNNGCWLYGTEKNNRSHLVGIASRDIKGVNLQEAQSKHAHEDRFLSTPDRESS